MITSVQTPINCYGICFDLQAVELAMKFVSDRAYDVARVACARLAEIKCYEQVC